MYDVQSEMQKQAQAMQASRQEAQAQFQVIQGAVQADSMQI